MSEMPVYPSSTIESAPIEPLDGRPRILDAAFWLFLIAIVVGLVSTAVTIPTLQATAAKAQSQLSTAGSTMSAATITNVAVGFALASAVIGAALWLLFVIFLRRDRGWSRWVLGAFAVLSLLGVASAYGLGALHAALVVLASVFTFLPAATAWFRAAAAHRASATRE